MKLKKYTGSINSQTNKTKMPFMVKIKNIFIKFPLASATIGIACIAAIAISCFLLSSQPKTEAINLATINKPVVEVEPPKIYSPVSYQIVDNETITKQAVTGIIIENLFPSSRPHSGLKQAETIFEAIAEGGITRFLALYQVNKPQLIGPVRSLRSYYIDWLAPYNASIAHTGGSPSSLKIIRNGQYRDIDEFLNGKYYWRSTDRRAPHNVYTSFAKLDELNAKKGYMTSSPDVFKRRQHTVINQPGKVSEIDLRISSPAYNVKYVYDSTNNNYKRFMGGVPHLDREEGQIAPNAVIAIVTQMTQVIEDKYREKITTIGENKAFVFQNGRIKEAIWKKPSHKQQIRFYDKNNQELAINSGQVWITAVPNDPARISWK